MEDKEKLIELLRDIEDILINLPFETQLLAHETIEKYSKDLNKYMGVGD